MPPVDARSPARELKLRRRLDVAGDPRAREELIELHMPMARRMAARYAGVAEPFDDLLQVASLGLVNAVDRFEPSRGVPFRGFAKPTILGELKRHFRDKTWTVRLPRPLHDLMVKVDVASDEAYGTIGRAPSVEELSNMLGVGHAEVLEVLEAARVRTPISLDAPPVADPEVAGGEWVGRIDDSFESAENRVALRALMPGLAQREKEILRLRFVEEMPQTLIADRLGCSQMQVSRLLRRTLERLREEAQKGSAEVSRPSV